MKHLMWCLMHTSSSVNICLFFLTIHCKIDVHNFVIGTNHSFLHGRECYRQERLLPVAVSICKFGKGCPPEVPFRKPQCTWACKEALQRSLFNLVRSRISYMHLSIEQFPVFYNTCFGETYVSVALKLFLLFTTHAVKKSWQILSYVS